jgi:hypothetical protein
MLAISVSSMISGRVVVSTASDALQVEAIRLRDSVKD